MKRRMLGSTGLETSAVGLGCLSMSDFYGRADEREAIATIHHALDLGIDLLDTADCYGPETNELLVGRALRGRRDEAIISTKFGFVRDGAAWNGLDGRPEHVRSACEASLRRLGVDYIDLYSLHCPDPKVPIEETVGAMADLVVNGKVRFLGISNVTANHVRRAHAVHPITAVQDDYSIMFRSAEVELIPCVAQLGIGFVAFSPLARGLLSGTITRSGDLVAGDYRRHLSSFSDENLPHNMRLVAELARIATSHEATPAQVALAWLLAQRPPVLPIPGTARVSRLDENAGATNVNLDPEELATLGDAFGEQAVAGSNQWSHGEHAAAAAERAQATAAGSS